MKLRTMGFLGLGAGLGVGAAVLVLNPPSWWFAERDAPKPTTDVDASMDAALYTCGMHPDVIRHEPGSCPICGMRLVRKTQTEADTGGVRVSQQFLQNFAVRTAPVERRDLPISIRTVGELAHNEEKVFSVNTKFEGWIESARVNNVGEFVTAGDPLFEIYSPQLVTTAREFLAAMDYVARLERDQAYPEAVQRARSLLDAARERLSYWDMSAAQIDALAAAKSAPRTITFHSPASGVVVDKMGDSLDGMKLSPGMTVLKIADHTTLWAEADFYEEDLRHVHVGSRATITAAAFPERRWEGSILFFRSAVNAETRTLTAFIEVANDDLVLRPRMYVDVVLHVDDLTDVIAIPAESVLHSGARTVAIVARNDGAFEPREVELGIRSGELQQVTAGLAMGERVVVSSQFLIDSESNLRAAIGQLLRGDEQAAGAAMPHHNH
ncbi:MAG: efflux RND transporter periplasmic adaptor subunit [Gammaproteobacteria bacterium]|nr:efflux RND transporter periplasmic adaptor subunit [Gammaproteobacteria bacterium]